MDDFALLRASISTVVFWHEFCVCPMLHIDCIIGAEVLYSQKCSLLNQSGDQRCLDFGVAEFEVCRDNRHDPEEGLRKQLQ